MPPPMPLPGALSRNCVGSQAGSASSSANRGRMVSQASSADVDAPIDSRTAAMKPRTTGVSRKYSSPFVLTAALWTRNCHAAAETVAGAHHRHDVRRARGRRGGVPQLVDLPADGNRVARLRAARVPVGLHDGVRDLVPV